jgi:hypothetical protein
MLEQNTNMKRKNFEEQDDESSSKRTKLNNTNTSLTLLSIDSSVLQHEVFNYLQPMNFLTMLTTCKHFHSCLQKNDTFMFYRLLFNKNKRFEYPLPHYSFFSSNAAKDVISSYMFPYYGEISVTDILSNTIRKDDEMLWREVLKLFAFCVEDFECIPWLKKDIEGLKKLFQLLSSIVTYNYRQAGSICEELDNLIGVYMDYVTTAKASNNDSIADRCHEYQVVHGNSPRNIILATLRVNSNCYPYLSNELKNDKQIMLYAISQSKSLFYKSTDVDLILNAVKSSPSVVSILDFSSQPNEVRKAVKLNPYALIYVCPFAKNDRETVLNAIRQRGLLLRYASLTLQQDPDVIAEACNF